MTEKRFNIKPSAIVDDVTVIIDNQKEYTFPVLDSTLNYMFCKVLNEQHETIQRLKENKQLKSEIEKLSYANEDLLSEKRNWQRMSDEYCKLSEENEHIKQTLDDMIESERTELGRSVLKQLKEQIK